MGLNMRFIINIEGTPVLLTLDQLQELVHGLEGAEKITNKYVGNKKGDDNTDYLKLIDPYCASDALSLRVMSSETYETKKLVTKLQMENA
jgi:hypothetical protein